MWRLLLLASRRPFTDKDLIHSLIRLIEWLSRSVGLLRADRTLPIVGLLVRESSAFVVQGEFPATARLTARLLG